MRISRREFLKYCSVAAGALGLTATDLLKLENTLALTGGVKVIWLNGAACTGCTVSLANSMYYASIQNLLLAPPAATSLDIGFMETLSSAQGDQARAAADSWATSGFVLALEGSLQSDGYCEVGSFAGAASENLVDVFDNFATSANCLAILGIGTCACYGGIPAGDPNPTGAIGIVDHLKAKYGTAKLPGGSTNPDFDMAKYRTYRNKTINIPGCAPNPNWIVGTIAYLIAHNLAMPALDALRRPRSYYGERICNNCERFAASKGHGGFAFMDQLGNDYKPQGFILDPNDIGDPDKRDQCLKYVGCKGSRTKSDCSWRKWHSPAPGLTGVNWCVGTGAPCQGCVQNYFPDRMSPFHYLR